VSSTPRAALVTGAASGIGAAVVARLRRDGWDVLTTDVRGDVDVVVDLTTREGNVAAVAAAIERFGRLDAVIPSAGFQHVAPIDKFPEDRWDAVIALLLTSPFLLARHAWPHLRASGEGRFVVIASVHSLVASSYKAAYVAAKHGVLGLVRTLALEGAPHGISASAVCPAYVRTPLVEGQITDQARAHGLPEDRVLEEVILASQPVKRLIEPAEVAATVAFLVGPDGRAFTGAPVIMDQGWSAR
jgi:3-hydroxybutyrate dehydrogenase